MKFVWINLFLLYSTVLFSQSSTINYKPSNFDSIKLYLKKINHNFIKGIDVEHTYKVKKVFKDRNEKVVEAIEDSTYIFNPEIDNYLAKILNEVYKVNPSIDFVDYKFFINNSIIPNAACYGDGMFEINLGLLVVMDSDDELAFVICHEIAHKILNHSIKNVSNSISNINSKESKQRIRDVKRKKYGAAREALAIIDELNLDMLTYSKEVEFEADSLGYLLFKETKYKKLEVFSSLNKLNVNNDEFFDHKINLDSIFNFNDYPFNPSWVKKSTSIFNLNKEFDEFELQSDTVRTHPELEFRIKKLKNVFEIKGKDYSGNSVYMNELKKTAICKSIESTIDLKHFDLSIYELVKFYELNQISSEFYYYTMARVFKGIYEAKKFHELGKTIPHENNLSDERQLNRLRLFLHKLELGEVKKIGLNFCKENESKFNNTENFNSIYKYFKI